MVRLSARNPECATPRPAKIAKLPESSRTAELSVVGSVQCVLETAPARAEPLKTIAPLVVPHPWLYSVAPRATHEDSKECMPTMWPEGSLRQLEEQAREYAMANTHAQEYHDPGRLRFSLRNGRLHGPFVAWREPKAKVLDASSDTKGEIENTLPKWFEGQYGDGKRDGVFKYWDKTGQEVVWKYQDGKRVR